jgi:hypothetical protein
MNTNRPATVTSAAVLLLLLSVYSLTTPFLPVDNKPPLMIIVYQFIVGGIGSLLVVFGLWRLKWWGLRLSMLFSAVSILTTVPGLFLAPPVVGKAITEGLIVVNVLVLVLVTLPVTRKAVASERVRVAASPKARNEYHDEGSLGHTLEETCMLHEGASR